jgi:rubrerythrin
MGNKIVRKRLIHLLQNAHAGERAAAIAYSRHWRILKNADEITAVKQIEIEEWKHRDELRKILLKLESKPRVFRELIFLTVGTVISFGCYFCRRFFATYFAGILERNNVDEYQEAFELAEKIGLTEFMPCFLAMKETEIRHEEILRKMVNEHWLFPFLSLIFGWGKPKQLANEV